MMKGKAKVMPQRNKRKWLEQTYIKSDSVVRLAKIAVIIAARFYVMLSFRISLGHVPVFRQTGLSMRDSDSSKYGLSLVITSFVVYIATVFFEFFVAATPCCIFPNMSSKIDATCSASFNV